MNINKFDEAMYRCYRLLLAFFRSQLSISDILFKLHQSNWVNDLFYGKFFALLANTYSIKIMIGFKNNSLKFINSEIAVIFLNHRHLCLSSSWCFKVWLNWQANKMSWIPCCPFLREACGLPCQGAYHLMEAPIIFFPSKSIITHRIPKS
jgi:hypothetical protein